jgi:PAS domain S-box-containing protein
MHDTHHITARTPGRAIHGAHKLQPSWIAWVPLAIFICAEIGLWFRDAQTPSEAPGVLLALSLALTFAPWLAIAVLFSRGFFATGAPGILSFSCGAALWSASGLAPFLVYMRPDAEAANALVTVHNLTVWAASLCCLAGAALLHRNWSPIEKRGIALVAAHGLALAAAASCAACALKGWTPAFFVQGEGATLERQFVLGSTIVAILLTCSMLRKGDSPRSSFLDWFALALLLLAVGYAGLMLQTTVGGVLGWVSRAAQFLGGVYMLAAARAAFVDPKAAFLAAAASEGGAPHRYSLAVAIVLVAAVLRIVFLHAVGAPGTFITFYPAVMLAALYGGFRAGAFATFLSAAITDYFWIDPVGSVLGAAPGVWGVIGLYILNCLLISWLVERMRNAHAQLRDVEADRRKQLERTVAARTAELEFAKEEKTRHLAAATATEAELQAVLDAVPAAIWIARDPSYATVQANRAATNWMRIPEGANSSRSGPSLLRFDIFDKHGLPVANEDLPIRRAARGEEVSDYEFDWRFADGERRSLFGNAAPLHDTDGNIAGGVAAFIDITERKRAEEALRDSEERYRRLVELIPAAMYTIDAEGRITFYNEQAAAIWGRRPKLGDPDERFCGSLLLRRPDGTLLPHSETPMAEALASGAGRHGAEVIVERPDGTRAPVMAYIDPIRDREGRIAGAVNVFVDITERKRAEEAAAAAHRQLQSIIDNAPATVYAFDLEERYILVNTAVAALLDSTPAQLIGKKRHEFMPKEDADWHEANDREVIAAGRALEFEEYNQLHRSITWLTTKFPLRDAQGRIYAVAGISTDISQRKQAEEALRESEERERQRRQELETTLSVIPAAVFVADDKTCSRIAANRAGYKLLRMPEGENVSKSAPEAESPKHFELYSAAGEVLPADRRPMQWAAATGKSIEGFEYEIRFADGAHKHLFANAAPLFDDAGEVRGAIGALIDITERRHMETALRESEERYRQLADAMPQLVWTANPDGIVDYYNARAAEYGIAASLEPTNDDWAPAIHPDDLAPALESWRDAVAGGQAYQKEHRVLMADGGYRWHLSRAQPQRNEEGVVVKWFGASTDIDDLKRAEEALHRKSATLLQAQRCAGAGVWDVDLGNNSVTWSEPYYDLYGLPKSVEPSLSIWMDSVHPDDRESVRAECERALAARDEQHLEFRILRDGQVRWLQSEGRVICDSANRPARVTGIIWDITERKRAEAALRESEERFRGIYQHAGTGIAITDLQGRFHSCNPAFAALLGYSEAELRDFHFPDLVHPEDREENVAGGVRLRAREIASLELFNRYIRKDGKAVWVHKRVSMVHDADGKPTHHVALVTDMTGRKRYEEHIGLLLKEVNHRAKNMLAVVQSIARHTAATNAKDFAERFGERVRALAVSQDLLVKSEWRGVDLVDLIRLQLAHFADLIGIRIALSGPSLSITASTAQTIGMTLHELSTNAGKYGALSDALGRVEIAWSLKLPEDGLERFAMEWRETGGPRVTAPDREGFGSIVISKVVRMSLDAEVGLEFAPDGIIWRMECPSDNVLERNR